MQDSSAIPVRRLFDGRAGKAKNKVEGLAPSPLPPSPLPSISPAGPRKLVRPPMPAGTSLKRFPMRAPALSSLLPSDKHRNSAGDRGESSHAEAFYFQKQIQSQTLMVFVLEDGEQLEGQIEWYDRNAIKIRHSHGRTLIYKASIKYLYKAAENGH